MEQVEVNSKNWKSLIKPAKLDVQLNDDKSYAKIIAEPLEKGYGLTLGNSLRRILLSSIQVLSTDHRFEKWSLFPAERKKLIKLINNSSNKTLILSGDRHRAGMYELDEIVEITSSSMNKPIKTFSEKKGFKKYFDQAMDLVFYEDDELALGETYMKENFGFIKIYSEQKLLELNVFDINGKSVLSHNLKLSKS